MNTITLPRSVVEQALEALDEIAWSNNTRRQSDRANDARIVLRAALEQPQVEQEPDAFREWWRMRPSLTRLQAWLIWKDEHKQPPRQPLTDAQINDHRLALPYDGEDLPDPWDFKQGVRAAERAHGIGGEA